MYLHSRFISEIKVECELFKIPSNCSDQCMVLVNKIQLPTKSATHDESVLAPIGFSVKKCCENF